MIEGEEFIKTNEKVSYLRGSSEYYMQFFAA